jgi:hypothetical protein
MNGNPPHASRNAPRLPRISAISWILCALLLCGAPLPALFWLNFDPQSFFALPPPTLPLSEDTFSWFWWLLYAVLGGSVLLLATRPLQLFIHLPKAPRLVSLITAALLTFSWLAAWHRWSWFTALQHHSFILIWFAYIAFMNALVHEIHGSCPLLREWRAYLLTFPLSAFFWWMFEYLNRITQNWHYVHVEHFSPAEYAAFASLSFSTVLPSLWVTHEFLQRSVLSSASDKAIILYGNLGTVAALAAAITAATMLPLLPNILFAAIWVFPLIFAVAPEAFRRESLSFPAAALSQWAVTGLWCGFLWELWNISSLAKWVYVIPYVQRMHLFEMPIVGYAGYLPFGVLCGLLITSVKAEKKQ